jgi:hypothetical protein
MVRQNHLCLMAVGDRGPQANGKRDVLSLLALAASNDPLAVWASLDHRLMGLRHDVGS